MGVEEYANPTAEELACEVEGRLAEMDMSAWDESTLRLALRPLVGQ